MVPEVCTGIASTSGVPITQVTLVLGDANTQNGETNNVGALKAKLVDLTVKEPKWEFSTTTQGDDSGDTADTAKFARLSARTTLQELSHDVQEPLLLAIPPYLDAQLRLLPLEHLADSTGLPPTPVSVSVTALYASNTPLLPDAKSDKWKVKNYGYSLGRPRECTTVYSSQR